MVPLGAVLDYTNLGVGFAGDCGLGFGLSLVVEVSTFGLSVEMFRLQGLGSPDNPKS